MSHYSLLGHRFVGPSNWTGPDSTVGPCDRRNCMAALLRPHGHLSARCAIAGGKLFAGVTSWQGGLRRTVRMYELSNGQQLYELPSFYSPHEPPNVLFLPGSRQFITIWGGPSSKKLQPSRHLALYDSRNGERLGEFLSRYGAAQPELSPDGRWLVAETWHTLGFQLWDVEKRQPLFKLHPKMP